MALSRFFTYSHPYLTHWHESVSIPTSEAYFCTRTFLFESFILPKYFTLVEGLVFPFCAFIKKPHFIKTAFMALRLFKLSSSVLCTNYQSTRYRDDLKPFALKEAMIGSINLVKIYGARHNPNGNVKNSYKSPLNSNHKKTLLYLLIGTIR